VISQWFTDLDELRNLYSKLDSKLEVSPNTDVETWKNHLDAVYNLAQYIYSRQNTKNTCKDKCKEDIVFVYDGET